MTAEAHAHARFRRAIERRALWAAEDAARELPNLPLDDALQLVHLLRRPKLAKVRTCCVALARALHRSRADQPQRLRHGHSQSRQASGLARLGSTSRTHARGMADGVRRASRAPSTGSAVPLVELETRRWRAACKKPGRSDSPFVRTGVDVLVVSRAQRSRVVVDVGGREVRRIARVLGR